MKRVDEDGLEWRMAHLESRVEYWGQRVLERLESESSKSPRGLVWSDPPGSRNTFMRDPMNDSPKGSGRGPSESPRWREPSKRSECTILSPTSSLKGRESSVRTSRPEDALGRQGVSSLRSTGRKIYFPQENRFSADGGGIVEEELSGPTMVQINSKEESAASGDRMGETVKVWKLKTQGLQAQLLKAAGSRGPKKAQSQEYLRSLRYPWLARLVLHRYFDYTLGLALVLNALLIGFQVNYEAVQPEHESHSSFFSLECIFVVFFTAELTLRFLAFGKDTFEVCGYIWCTMDTVLVIFALTDFFMTIFEESSSGFSGAAGRVIKLLRMARIIRVARMLRFLGELRVMLSMVTHSMISLFWLVIFLILILFVFAIVLTKGTTEYIRVDGASGGQILVNELESYYGSLFTTMYTLFRSITGGLTWGECVEPLMKVGAFYFFLFLVFICFSIFCVLNLVTGILVDGAIELAKRDRLIMMDKENRSREAMAGHLIELLERIDDNNDGSITREEFVQALKSKETASFIEALEIDVNEAMSFYDLLDHDGNNSVDIFEWMDGMRRLKGDAKSSDLQQFRLEVRNELQHLHKLMNSICKATGATIPRMSARPRTSLSRR